MKLKKCPFCGSDQIDVITIGDLYEDDENSNSKIANCNFNKGGCGAVGGARPTVREAIEAWNRRAKNKRPWTKNTGQRPVDGDTKIDVKWADGEEYRSVRASQVTWYIDEFKNITHWRLAK